MKKNYMKPALRVVRIQQKCQILSGSVTSVQSGDTGIGYGGGISIGFDARMSLTYNVGRFFLNAYGQFNNIRYSHNNTHGYLNDWFVNTSIGIRL